MLQDQHRDSHLIVHRGILISLEANIKRLPDGPKGKIQSKALVKFLPNEQIDKNVRCNIADAIGKLGDKTAVPALIEILPNEQIHPFVRCSIVRSIGKLGDKTAAPALAEMLSNELNFLLHEAINRAIEALMKKN